MVRAESKGRWRRFLSRLGFSGRSHPTWGADTPTIMGVCARCGAVVLQGWHQETPDGLHCQRCARKG